MEYYLATRIDEILQIVATWMHMESIIFSDIISRLYKALLMLNNKNKQPHSDLEEEMKGTNLRKS